MKTIRLITAADISAVMQIQATAYPIAYQESAEVFLARVQAAPLSCWILEQDNLASAYLFSYLSKKGRITSLNTSFTITEDADCLYLHDLAVSPQLRGQGAGDALIANAFNYVYDKKLAWSALVSVQQSEAFWNKRSYVRCDDLSAANQENLHSYDQITPHRNGEAIYMLRKIFP